MYGELPYIKYIIYSLGIRDRESTPRNQESGFRN